jgi:hypothetical protein
MVGRSMDRRSKGTDMIEKRYEATIAKARPIVVRPSSPV